MNAKETLRTEMLKKRKALPFDRRFRSEVLITDRILGHQWYYSATDILVYKSCGSEVSTEEIIKDALQHGKRVYLPKVLSPENGTMEFYRITGETPLTKGYGGILEPPAENPYIYTEETAKSTLMIMPGLAYDRKRSRIGYGKGFYDRYLSAFSGSSVGVVYSDFVIPRVPRGRFDAKVDVILTEKSVIVPKPAK